MALRKRLLLLFVLCMSLLLQGGAAQAVWVNVLLSTSVSDRGGMASASCGHTMSSPTSSSSGTTHRMTKDQGDIEERRRNYPPPWGHWGSGSVPSHRGCVVGQGQAAERALLLLLLLLCSENTVLRKIYSKEPQGRGFKGRA